MKKILSILLLLLCCTGVMAQKDLAAQGNGKGLPIFRNILNKEYGAHNRNFDVLVDRKGRVYVANFEGVIVYDYSTWDVFHTPNVNRVLCLHMDDKGTVWFGGFNVLGYFVEKNYWLEMVTVVNDSIRRDVGEVDQISQDKFGRIYFHTSQGDTYAVKENKEVVKDRDPGLFTPKEEIKWNGHNVDYYTSIDGISIYCLENQGLVFLKDGKVLQALSTRNGLCSNNVSKLCWDKERGNIWGTTSNGIFVIQGVHELTRYTDTDGIQGEVTSIKRVNPKTLMVGTLEGLFLQEGNSFRQLPQIRQACWNMDRSKQGNIMAATAQGLYVYARGGLHQVTNRHTLSVLVENEEHVLTGEVGGVHRHYRNGKDELLSELPNVIKMEYGEKDTLWVLTVDGDVYSMAPGQKDFKLQENSTRLSVFLDYTDRTGRHWTTEENGLGVKVTWKDGKQTHLATRVKAFKDYNIHTVHADSTEVWLGGDFGMIRMNLPYCDEQPPYAPKMYFRYAKNEGRNLEFAMGSDYEHPLKKTLYSYRMTTDGRWSDWGTDLDLDLLQLSYGDYQLRARCIDAYGNIVETGDFKFRVPFPFYLSWYANLFYLLLASLAVWAFLQYRTQRIREQNLKLENTVRKRTAQVMEQKNEIEQKSHELERTLVKLRETQSQLIRQEREATVGKLIRGLVDRILNPMNYINNFSHLTRELVKDLRNDVEDEKDVMSKENYEDAVDVMGMMDTNLAKIEEHGLSTSRILKAMEEMLNDHPETPHPIDLNSALNLCVERTREKYFKKDIADLGIEIETELSDKPMKVMGQAEWMTRTFMSVIQNSIYAIHRKAAKFPGYKAKIRVSLKKDGELAEVHIWDNGIGIEKQILKSIFDPFFTTKPTNQASGLGLYFCQRAMQEVGGNIEIDSVKNEYTDCKITLKLVEQ